MSSPVLIGVKALLRTSSRTETATGTLFAREFVSTRRRDRADMFGERH